MNAKRYCKILYFNPWKISLLRPKNPPHFPIPAISFLPSSPLLSYPEWLPSPLHTDPWNRVLLPLSLTFPYPQKSWRLAQFAFLPFCPPSNIFFTSNAVALPFVWTQKPFRPLQFALHSVTRKLIAFLCFFTRDFLLVSRFLFFFWEGDKETLRLLQNVRYVYMYNAPN